MERRACSGYFGIIAQDNHKGIEPEHGFLFADKLKSQHGCSVTSVVSML